MFMFTVHKTLQNRAIKLISLKPGAIAVSWHPNGMNLHPPENISKAQKNWMVSQMSPAGKRQVFLTLKFLSWNSFIFSSLLSLLTEFPTTWPFYSAMDGTDVGHLPTLPIRIATEHRAFAHENNCPLWRLSPEPNDTGLYPLLSQALHLRNSTAPFYQPSPL